MRIVIDMQGAQTGSAGRGIGRYSNSLVKAIARNQQQHEIFLLFNAQLPKHLDELRSDFAGLIPEDHMVVFTPPTDPGGLVNRNLWYRETAELVREWVIDTISPDVVLITSLFEGAGDSAVTSLGRFETATKVAVVLYDLIPMMNPEIYLVSPEGMHWYYSKIDCLRKAELLLAISKSAGHEALDLLAFERDRIVTVYPAADERFKQKSFSPEERQSFFDRLGITRKFILHASAFEPRKNFQGLIRAFSLLPKAVRQSHQLVLLAVHVDHAAAALRRFADEAGLEHDELVTLGYVSDQDLVGLYSLCTLFAFPSLYEGFGLPPLEAMQCGAPVIGSDAASIPEVIDRHDALFDPHSVESIAAVLERALTDETFRESLRTHGPERAKAFNWDRSAELAIAALEKLAGPSAGERRPVTLSALLDRITAIDTGEPVSREDLAAVAQSISTNEQMLEDLHRRETAASDRYVKSIGHDFWSPRDRPRILLLKLDHIGDFVVGFDAFRMIRATWPNAHITLVCGSWNRSLAEQSGIFDRVLSCDFYPDNSIAYEKEKVVAEGVRQYRTLDLETYDLAVDLRYYDDNRILLTYTGARYRAGYAADGVPLDLALPMGRESEIMAHMGARTMALAAAVTWTFGRPLEESATRLSNGRSPTRFFETGPVVGISPGTGNPIKAWGRERFRQLAALLHHQSDCRFVLLGGERDRSDTEFIRHGLPSDRVVDLAGRLPIVDLAPVIAGLDLFIGNDTGTTHMAAALGIPTICLFSGQIYLESWRPVGEHVRTMRNMVPCAPCYLTSVARCQHNHECMNIPPSRVLAEANKLLEKSAASHTRAPRLVTLEPGDRAAAAN